MKKSIISSVALFLATHAAFAFTPYIQHNKVYVYTKNSPYFPAVKNAFERFHVDFEVVSTLSQDDDALYIIFDAYGIKQEELPKHYIIYQTYDLNNTVRAYYMKQLEYAYTKVLKGAVAVWDYSRDNIASYSNVVGHYYHLPQDYEYVDPVILPCFLPTNALATYKELLAYSNQVDTEISSLIPMLFFHSFNTQPTRMLETGVCFGFSTQAFIKTSDFFNTYLIGIDFDPNITDSYNCVKNGVLCRMDDLKFKDYYHEHYNDNELFDVIFIDTSHEYQHTLDELRDFLPLLAPHGILMFHDANVTPLIVDGKEAWWRINNTIQKMHGNTPNPRGVAPAIREFFSIPFDETKYINTEFVFNNANWHMIHYPFCNGLTVLRRVEQ
jgi:predicted O-methyltransferase YrrM